MWSPRIGEGSLPVLTPAEQLAAMASYMRARGYLDRWETYDSSAYRDYPRWLRISLEFDRAGRGSA